MGMDAGMGMGDPMGPARAAGLLDGMGRMDPASLGNLASPDPKASKEEIRRVAEGFEEIFLRLLLSLSLPEGDGGFFGTGPGSGVVRGMFVEQVGGSMAARRSLGIADLVERSLQGDVGRDDSVAAAAPGKSPEAVPADLLMDLRA